MNECVEVLNRWGENFWGFAWPMLWQSSLLIAVVFVFDLFCARRVRASVRYVLWMVVLVKLILPPSLALPTAATWWLWRPHPVVEHPVIQNYSVSYDNTVPIDLPAPTVPMILPPTKLSGEAWDLLAAVTMGLGLLLWLVFRWLRVAGNVRCAATAPADFDGILAEARQLAGLRRRPRLKVIDDVQSPAVYGLFRPVILLPRALTAKLSAGQLRAVMLHETAHLRRGDIWVNCAQTLLQIAYWWHPFLWVANGRIRRVREEAVDDAVMLALRDGADTYAPTLLEVAKYAFRRPLASLGLVGILESRSALRQRVERLVDFRPPRKAGVTLLSLCGIFAFAAVALPMGQGPEQTKGTRSFVPQPSPSVTTNGSPAKFEMRTFGVGTSVFIANLRKITGAQISNSDPKGISAALKKFFEKATVEMSPPKTVYFNSQIRGGTLFVYATPRDVDIIERIVERLHESAGGNDGWLKSIDAGTAPAAYFDVIADEAARQANRQATYRKLNQVRVTLSYDYVSLSEVIRDLKQQSLELDPDKRGIDFLYDSRNIVDDGRIKITLSMDDASLQDVVNEICSVSDHPISYSIGDRGGVVFSPAGKSIDASDLEENDHRDHVVSTNTGPRFDVEHYEVLGNTVLTPGTIDAVITNIDGALGTNVSFEGVRMVVQRLQQEYHDRGYVTARVTLPQQKLTNATVKVQVFESHYSDTDRKAIYRKLNNIQLDQVIYQSLPLSEVLRQLREESLRRDPERKGINFLFNPNVENNSRAGTPINPATGLPVKAKATLPSVDPTEINISLSLKNVSLEDLLDGICLVSDQPIKYSVENYGVVFSPKDTNSPQYEMRTFKINPNVLFIDLDKKLNLFYPLNSPASATNVVSILRQYFLSLGVDFDPPKTIFYGDRRGLLFVYATPKDLDVIEKAIQVLSYEPPMIHIKARVIEVPRTFFSSAVVKSSFRGLTNGWVLPNPDFQAFWHKLESQEGALVLAEPEVTTLSARQTQMRATITQSIVTNFAVEASTGASVPQTEQVETGPVLDVVPSLLSDGYTMQLTTIASRIDFVGYSSSRGLEPSVTTNAAGTGFSPVFQVSEASVSKKLYDGQTVVLLPRYKIISKGKTEDRISEAVKEKNRDKVEIVLVTATLIDTAGNRSHSDDEIPFAQTYVPPDQFPSSGGVSWLEQ